MRMMKVQGKNNKSLNKKKQLWNKRKVKVIGIDVKCELLFLVKSFIDVPNQELQFMNCQ